jgi:HAE1 family hydrophobic/amphiphilic exporter-1
VELQTGTRVSETKALAARIDKILMEKFPEINLISTSSGSDEEANFATMFSSTGTHTILYSMSLTDISERERSVWDIAEAFRAELEQFPEIVDYQVSTSDNGMGAMMSNNIAMEIYGYDIAVTNQVAKELAGRISEIPGATDIQISRDDSKPELQIELDQEKMIQHGLNTATVSAAIKNRVDGMIATRLREFGDEYDVIVRYKENFRNTISDIENIPIHNMQGQMVRLGEIADIKEYLSPPNIEHKRKERVVTVSATPHKRPLGAIAADIDKEIAEMDIPAGVSVESSGAIEDMMEAMGDLALLMVLSLVLVYLVMASQFESLKMPFIIMFSIPFAFSGVALAMFVTNTTFSLIAGIGAIMLIGIVVKNAIVLVDFINLMRDRGLELYEAVAVSGRSRLRPVLMTSLTTILAMLPLAMSKGEGAELWSPMGIAVIGGLVFSTLVTLVLVPVVYIIFARRGERNKKRGSDDDYNFLEAEAVN